MKTLWPDALDSQTAVGARMALDAQTAMAQ